MNSLQKCVKYYKRKIQTSFDIEDKIISLGQLMCIKKDFQHSIH